MARSAHPTGHATVRVLHVLPHEGGGGETYVDMLERMPGFRLERFYLSAGRTAASGLSSIPLRWPALFRRIVSSDLVHCHGDVASVLALPLLGLRPAVMTAQGLHMSRRVQGQRRKLMNLALTMVIHRCGAVICSSQAERADLAALARQPDLRKLHLVHNGIDPPPAIGQAERDSIRRELDVAPDEVLGLFVGQLEPRKAPLLAARAAIRVREGGARFVLAIVGDGPQANQLAALQGDAVKVLGHRDDVRRLLAAADVFVQPSEREGMSFAVLEAMSHGLTIVAADSSSNPEAIAEAGVLFAAGDESHLIEALKAVAFDAGLRVDLRGRAKARASEHFSPTAFLAASESIYWQLLDDVRAPGDVVGAPHA